MQLRTSNIINVIKGKHNYLDEKGNKLNPKDAIKRYMSITCACPESDYNEARITGIIENVVLDYISTSDEPDRFIRRYFDWAKFLHERHLFNDYKDQNDIDAWISALSLIQVRNGTSYMNGFNEYNIKVWDENTKGKTLLFPEVDNHV